MPPGFEQAVLALIGDIPPGCVCTYGTLAAMAGYPRHARHVGKLLSGLPEGCGAPWHRVLGAGGRVSRPGSHHADLQKLLLENEGVALSDNGRVSLKRYGWPAEYFFK